MTFRESLAPAGASRRRAILGLSLAAAAAGLSQGAPFLMRQALAQTRAASDGFIALPGGVFQMGSPQTERQREGDEVRHAVRVSPFFVDPFEVRQSDYEALMGKNPSVRKGADLPVENVSWLDAVAYCNALSLKRGLTPAYAVTGEAVAWHRLADGYRLLTEAEWEYAARAGRETIFVTGSQTDPEQLNYQGSYPYGMEENYVVTRDPSVRPGRNRGRTVAVDELAANAFGLYNITGNVSEWGFDYYGAYAVQSDGSPVVDPAGPAEGALRVARGGAFNDFGKHLRLAYRSACNPAVGNRNQGFRIARGAVAGAADIVTQAPRRVPMPAAPKLFLAYFSYSGNTAGAARMLCQKLRVNPFEIVMQEPYEGEIYEVSRRDMNAGVLPPLQGVPQSLQEADVVLLGYPTWWATVPPPVLAFLHAHDFSGKIILPFSSHGSTDFGESLSVLAKTVPGAWVGAGLEFYYSGGRRLEQRMDEWLAQSGLAVRVR